MPQNIAPDTFSVNPFGFSPLPSQMALDYNQSQGFSIDDLNPFALASQFFQGYLSGFSTLPIGEMPLDKAGQISRQIGHLGGFIGFGMRGLTKGIRSSSARKLGKVGLSSAAAAVGEFRSIPMFGADIVMKKLKTNQAGKAAFDYLQNKGGRGLIYRQALNEGLHLGIASTVSAVWEGPKEAMAAGLQGFVFGGLLGGPIANIPALKERDLASNVMRSMAGSTANALPVALMGGDTADIIYQGLLGAYFGYRQPNATMARAQEYLFQEARGRPIEDVLAPNSDMNSLPKAVQKEIINLSQMNTRKRGSRIFQEIFTRIGDPNSPEVKLAREHLANDRMSPMERIADEIAAYNSFEGTAASRSMVDFAKRVKGEHKIHELDQWSLATYAKLFDRVGKFSVEKGHTFDQFKKTASAHHEKIFGGPLKDEVLNSLQVYYMGEQQNIRTPIFGFNTKSGRIEELSISGRDYKGNRIARMMPHTIMHEVFARDLGTGLPKDAAYFMLDVASNFDGKLSNLSGPERTKLGNLKNVADKDAFFTTNDGTKIPMFDGSGEALYYPIHGEGSKDRIFYARYNDGGDAPGELVRIKEAFRVISGDKSQPVAESLKSGLAKEFKTGDKFQTEDFNVWEVLSREAYESESKVGMKVGVHVRFVTNVNPNESRRAHDLNPDATTYIKPGSIVTMGENVVASRFGGSSKKTKHTGDRFDEIYRQLEEKATHSLGLSKVEFAKMFVSNVRYMEAMHGVSGGKELSTWIGKEGFISDVKDFNKRLQPLFTSYYQIPKGTIGRKLRYAIVKDAIESTNIGREEATDGAVYASPEMVKKLSALMGLPEEGSSLKPFFVSPDDKHGLLIGKLALHKATGSLATAMQKEGLDFMIYGTAAKQRGSRQIYDVDMEGGNLIFGRDGKWGKKIESYEMDESHIRLSESTGDKVPSNLSVRFMKQILTQPMLEQIPGGKDKMNRFIKDLVDEAIHGTEADNQILTDYLADPTPERLKALSEPNEQGRVALDYVDKVKLYNSATRIGKEPLYEALLKRIMGDDNFDKIDEFDDYGRDHADKNDRSDLWMSGRDDYRGAAETFVRITKGSAAGNVNKATRNYVESKMTNWLISSMSRPYMNHAVVAVMKPFDMGLWDSILYDGKIIVGNGRTKKSLYSPLTKDSLVKWDQKVKGGFSGKGKGTPAGDGKDAAMREVADYSITEIASMKPSSTMTTRSALFRPVKGKPGIVMLARNGSLRGQELSVKTKKDIQDAKDDGNVFVVGDMPGVDEPYVRLLKDIDARFTIYHSGKKARITVTPSSKTELRTDFPNLTENSYLLEAGHRETMIPSHKMVGKKMVKARRKLGEVFDEYVSTKNVVLKDALEKDMEVLAGRVPMTDPSGAQMLKLAGFTDTEGYGVLLHGKTMRRLGGADLDIDVSYMYWDMPDVVREIIKANKTSGDTFGDAKKNFLKDPEGLPGIQSKDPMLKAMAMFDPNHRLGLSQEVAKGNDNAGIAVDARHVFGLAYSHVNAKEGGIHVENTKNATIRYKARGDGGKSFREWADGAVTAAVDVSKFGAMDGPELLQAKILSRVFSSIEITPKGSKKTITLDSPDKMMPLFTHGRGSGIRLGRNLGKMSIRDTFVGGIREGKRGVFGRTNRFGRALSMDERTSMIAKMPEGLDYGFLPSIIRSLSGVNMRSNRGIDYLMSENNRFFDRIKDFGAELNNPNNRMLFGFMYQGDKARNLFGYKDFANLTRVLKTYYHSDKYNVFSEQGRDNLSRNEAAFAQLEKDVMSVRNDKGIPVFRKSFEHPDLNTNTDATRMASLRSLASKVEDFVSNDVDNMVSLVVLRDAFIRSGLTETEASDLVNVSSEFKRNWSAAWRARKNEGSTEYFSIAKQRFKEDLADFRNNITPRGYTGDAERTAAIQGQKFDPRRVRNKRALGIINGGLDRFVNAINTRPERVSGSEKPINRNAVMDFIETASLSSYHFPEDSPIVKTNSVQAGYEVASQPVLMRYANTYKSLFESAFTASGSKIVTKDILRGDPASEQLEKSYAVKRIIKGIGDFGSPEKGPLSKGDQLIIDDIVKYAPHYSLFRDDPGMIVFVMRNIFGRAQPKDFTVNNLEAFAATLKQWRHGYGMFSWLTRGKGGEILRKSKEQRETSGRKLAWYHTLLFPRTQADFMKIDDLVALDRDKLGKGTPRELLTFTDAGNGRIVTERVFGKSVDAISHFDRLIEINGAMKDGMIINLESELTKLFDERLGFSSSDIIDPTTGKDIGDGVIAFSRHEMQISGLSRMIDRLRKGNYSGEYNLGDLVKFRANEIRRKREVTKTLLEKTGVKNEKELADYQVEATVQSGRTRISIGEYARHVSAISSQSMKEVYERYISIGKIGKSGVELNGWFKKNIMPFVEGSTEINIRRVTEHMNDVFNRGVLGNIEGHMPVDAARWLSYESEIHTFAREHPDKIPVPKSVEGVLTGKEVFTQFERTSMKREGFSTDVRSLREAQILASRIRRRVRTKAEEMNPKTRESLMRVANYYFKRFRSNDMRLMLSEGRNSGFSQYDNDLSVAQGRMNPTLYMRQTIRNRYPLLLTDALEGYWPHLGHDRVSVESDGVRKIQEIGASQEIGATDKKLQIKKIREGVNRILGRVFEDDAGTLDPEALYMIDRDTETFIASKTNEKFGSLLDRTKDYDGYRLDNDVLSVYSRQIASTVYGNLSQMLSRNVIRSFRNAKTADGSPVMGKFNATWEKWLRLYTRDTMNKPSVFSEDILNDPLFNIKKTPYYWLSDHGFLSSGGILKKGFVMMTGLHKITGVDKAEFKANTGRDMTPEEQVKLQKERLTMLSKTPEGEINLQQATLLAQKLRGFADVEAKYEMMSLLFHTKTFLNNVIGGTTNLIAHSGWKHFREAGKIDTWNRLAPGRFRDMKELEAWVTNLGIVEDYIIHEAAVRGRFRKGKMKLFIEDAVAKLKKENNTTSDASMIELARKHGLNDKAMDFASFFMRKSERWLRTRAFLTGYLKARDSMHPMDMDFDHPYLISQGKRAVFATQFVYGSANRPAFARTSLGKVYSRFKLWSWNSIRFRREIYQDAKNLGFDVRGREFERFKNIVMADMFMLSLASMFPFSMFENTLPPPFSWLKDTAEYFFGDEYETLQERFFQNKSAFYGSPFGPLNEAVPVLVSKTTNVAADVFRTLMTGETEAMSLYQIAVMFPFGRMLNDVYRSSTDPDRAAEFIFGLPLRHFGDFRDKVINQNLVAGSGDDLESVLKGGELTTQELKTALESVGYTSAEAARVMHEALDLGALSRTMKKTSTGKGYHYRYNPELRSRLDTRNNYGISSFVRGL